MSGVLNDCDALLQAASVRILNPDSAFINLTASAPGFHMTGTGAVDLATVTVTADLIALDGDVVFTGQGVTLSNVKARSVDASYVSGTGIVTATVVTNGETFARSYVIPVLRDGAAGAAGQPVYTWIKYADSAAGAGLSDDPAGKTYIGLAHNKSTAAESTNPADYAWALMKGGDGLPGAKGADGITYYTWIKYADQADGTGLYDVPNANTLYIGIAVNRTTATESTTKTDYVWSRFKGEQGVAGAPTYTWIKYADTAAGVGLSDDPTGKAYIGLAYNKSTATESTTATDYTWALIKGTDGQPGGKGADGATLYTWIKYSDVADGTGLYDIPAAGTLYIGIATNKSTATESTVKTDYVWSKFKGDQGVQDPTTYTWVKYADSAAGAGLSDDPTGKAYIGFAYNKATSSESTTATDYTWSLIKGTDGQPGGKGADGATLYTWIKYSDNADGTGLYDLPTASTQYLGIAVNKSTATESTVKTDYVWSKFRGADGVGTAGARGAGHYYVAGSSWSDVVAQAACPGGPVTNDVVTISSGTFVMEKRWTGSAWVENGVVINGKLIVPDSILASAIDARGLVIRDAQGNIVISAGGLQQGFEAPDTKNSEQKWGQVSDRPDDPLNLVRKSSFEDGQLGGWGGSSAVVDVSGKPWSKAVQISNRDNYHVDTIPVSPGETIYFECDTDASTATGTVRMGLVQISSTGVLSGWGPGAMNTSAGSVGWFKKTASVVLNANTVKIQPWLSIDAPANSAMGTARFANIRISRFQPGATVGAPPGTMVGSVTADQVATATTNFNAANDRNGAAVVAPTIAADGTAIDHTIRKDGGADISFEWSWAGSEGDIDGFLVFVHQRTSSAAYPFGTTPLLETVYTLPASRRAFILFGAAADMYTTIGVMAYRSVDKSVNAAGVIKSALVVPSLAAENPYRPSANVAFTGDITGTINGTAASTVVTNATAGKTANDAIGGINTSIGAKLSKAGNDEITGTISLRSQYAMLVGTANDGIFYGSTGIYGRKGGVTQLSVGADGIAYFAGTLGANVVKAGNIEAGAIRASHLAITSSAGNELPDPRFKDLSWWNLIGIGAAAADWGGQTTGWQDAASVYFGKTAHFDRQSSQFAVQKNARYHLACQVYISSDFSGQFSVYLFIEGQIYHHMGQPSISTWAGGTLKVQHDTNSPKGMRSFLDEVWIDPSVATGMARIVTVGRVDSGTIEFGGIRVIRMSDETLIGPGVVQTKHLVISKGGAVNSGQTGYGKGNGFWIEGAGNDHGARMSLGNELGRQLLCDPNNNVLGLVNADITNPNLQTSFSINMGDIYLTRQANGSLTTGLAVSASGGTAVRYQWSLTIEGGGDLELRGDPTGPGPILYAAGRERWVYGWVTCTAWSSTGASATRSTYIRIQFGTAVET